VNYDVAGKRIVINKNEIANWKNLTKVEMATHGEWTRNFLRLKSFTTDANYAYITLQAPESAIIYSVPEILRRLKWYFFSNAREFVDAPGE